MADKEEAGEEDVCRRSISHRGTLGARSDGGVTQLK